MYQVDNPNSYTSMKLVSFSGAVSMCQKYKKQGKTVGLCHGGFDLLHPGQVRHFESAKKLCDVLMVSVTSDQFVTRRKGEGRPIFTDRLRAYMIAHLDCVDYAFVSDYEKGDAVIKHVKPNFYIKGPDFIGKSTPGITDERDAIGETGGEIKYTNDPKLSTTQIIEYIQSLKKEQMLVVVDRDGTIILHNDYLGKERDWKKHLVLNKPVVSFLSYLETKYRPVMIVATNQSGVARGMFDEIRVRDIHNELDRQLKDQSVSIDSWQYCPDMDNDHLAKHPEIFVNKTYIKVKTKRKPAVDMVIDGLKELGRSLNDFSKILMIGDSKDDEGLAKNLKAKYIDVKGKSYQQLVTSISSYTGPHRATS